MGSWTLTRVGPRPPTGKELLRVDRVYDRATSSTARHAARCLVGDGVNNEWATIRAPFAAGGGEIWVVCEGEMRERVLEGRGDGLGWRRSSGARDHKFLHSGAVQVHFGVQ